MSLKTKSKDIIKDIGSKLNGILNSFSKANQKYDTIGFVIEKNEGKDAITFDTENNRMIVINDSKIKEISEFKGTNGVVDTWTKSNDFVEYISNPFKRVDDNGKEITIDSKFSELSERKCVNVFCDKTNEFRAFSLGSTIYYTKLTNDKNHDVMYKDKKYNYSDVKIYNL